MTYMNYQPKYNINMAIIKLNNFESPPVGQYVGIIYSVVDQGTQDSGFKDKKGVNKYNRQSIISVELHNLADPTVLTTKKQPYMGILYATHSLSPLSTLTKACKAAFGLAKYNEQIKSQGGINLADLLGQSFVCNIIEKDGDGVKLDPDTLAELQNKATAPPQVNPNVYFSLDQEDFSPSIYDSLKDNQKEKIANSPEYKQCLGESKVGDF